MVGRLHLHRNRKNKCFSKLIFRSFLKFNVFFDPISDRFCRSLTDPHHNISCDEDGWTSEKFISVKIGPCGRYPRIFKRDFFSWYFQLRVIVFTYFSKPEFWLYRFNLPSKCIIMTCQKGGPPDYLCLPNNNYVLIGYRE